MAYTLTLVITNPNLSQEQGDEIWIPGEQGDDPAYVQHVARTMMGNAAGAGADKSFQMTANSGTASRNVEIG